MYSDQELQEFVDKYGLKWKKEEPREVSRERWRGREGGAGQEACEA